ncbi:hypothetical protein [Legionella sp. W05-934-2]|uniref:hypothetical protein n=1 Tax=Legionella sp. W05-934-2 TaxID=1198649 RepID=UPI003461A808
MLLPDLNELLSYRHPLTIKRFKRNYPHYADEAEELFKDVLKYLWLSRKHQIDLASVGHTDNLDFSCNMHKEMRVIDEMWHTFILITRDYADFCHRYFGEFMHHVPEVGDEADEEKAIDLNRFEHELTRFLSYTYDHLGENTVKRWFAAYL